MQVHDLGAVWVESDGLPLALNGQRMTSALSALVVNLGEKVRTDVLIASVWGAEPSPRAPAALDTLMWRMRRVLDPGRSARAASTVLPTVEQGYRLAIPAESVDSWQFDAVARTLADPAVRLDAAERVGLTTTALAMWRGRPYDDVDDDGWLEPRRTHLVEQHLTVQQARIAALLDVGQPEQAVAELVPVLAEHPFVERLWYLRILGLYQAGRASAALGAYTEVRRLLDQELALEPGSELQELQQKILQRDQSLAGSPLARAARSIVKIPVHRTPLVGRAADVDAVDELLRKHRVVSVTGSVGCGKTRLAAAVATRAQSRFLDGVYFVDLSDLADEGAVADRVQQTLRIEGEGAAPSAQVVAKFVAERELLIVLDNCEQVTAATTTLVDAVLDHDGPTRMLITSRRVLGVEDERTYPLRPLDLRASLELFADRAERQGISIDLQGPQREEVTRICEAVDGLPLGIELAAARTQVFQLHEIAASVADHPMSLGSSRGSENLRDSIDSSHATLTEQERVAHRRLSVLPPRFTLDAAVAACSGPDLMAEEVPSALIGLVAHSLLEATKPERPNGPSVFRQLVPIRAHAAQHLRDADEFEPPMDGLLHWISATLAEGPRMGQSDGGALDLRLEDNRRTITAALELAIAAGPSDDVLLSLCRLVPYWWLDGKLSPETVRLAAAAAAAVGPANSAFAAAAAGAAHGSFLALTGQASESSAVDLLKAIEGLRAAPPELAIFAAELLLAIAAACWVSKDMAAADAAADGVAAYGEDLDDPHIQVLAKAVRSAMGLVTDPAAAGEAARAVMAESEEIGNVSAQIMCCHTLYMAAMFAQDGPGGLPWNEQAIRLQQEIGQRNAATTLEARGSLYVMAGSAPDAIRCYGSAHFQYARIGRGWAIPGTEELMAAARSELTPEEFERAWASGERLAASDVAGAWV